MLAIKPDVMRRALLLPNALKWLLPEIEVCLTRVRAQIEAQQEADSDTLETGPILEELSLVYGALRVASCRGGQLLAEELCSAVMAVSEGRCEQPAAVLATVSGATLQLSDYLDVLMRDVPDRAAVLQPVIGELRLASGRPTVTEADLFVRQMQISAVRPVLTGATVRAAGAAQVIAGKLLPAFQALLLQWIRGVDAESTLLKLRKVGDHVASNATTPEVTLLWSAFAAAADSLLAVPRADSLELKRWFGRMGQQLRQLAEEGEAALVPTALETAWWILAHASQIDCGSSRWVVLREALSLDACLPVEAALKQTRAQLRGPNTSLLDKVAQEVRLDLATVKDSLDLALRAGNLSEEARAGLGDRLSRIASTLSLLGLPQLEQVLLNQVAALATLGDGDANAQDPWMRIATALLRVESSLESALFKPLRVSTQDEQFSATRQLIDSTPHSQDLRESIAALLREMLVDLAKLKAQLDSYLKGGELRDPGEPAAMLGEVTAGLVMLDHSVGAELSGLLRDWLAAVGPATLREDAMVAQRFADAVASLELYIEALHTQLPHPERVLDPLSGALQYFQASQVLVTLDEIDVEPEASTSEPLPEAESPTAAEPVLQPEPEPAPTTDAPPAPLEPKPAIAVEVMPPPGGLPLPTEEDPEIREIFIEEGAEVLAHLRELLPAFRQDSSQAGHCAELRRGFHTLKGSGRMVGATRISELGWAVEHLLNRCIEGALPINRSVVATIESAIELLPALLDDFRSRRGGSETDAAQTLTARAHYLASGRALEMVDAEVLEVFRADSLDRLAEAERWLSSEGDYTVEPDLVRALHTLKGSAAAVNAEGISQLASAFETILRRLAHAEVSAPPAVRAVFAEALPVLREWVLSAGRDPLPAATDWLLRVEALKPFLPPAGEGQSHSGSHRDAVANQAFDRLQEAEAGLVAWMASPAQPELAAVLARNAEQLAETGAPCAPLARVAKAIAERLRASDLDLVTSVPPDAGFFQALARALEHCYQLLDSYREGGVRDNGRALAEQLAQLPLHTVPATPSEPEPEIEFEVTALDALGGQPSDPRAWSEPVMASSPVEEPASIARENAWAAVDTQPGTASSEAESQFQATPLSMTPPAAIDDPELAAVFVDEARTLLQTLRSALSDWSPANAPPPEVERALHTLAGSARMSGYESLGDLAYAFEKRLRTVTSGSEASTSLHTELDAACSAFAEAIEAF
jgi:chemosensory pili system protein ChpA (sensor histidine kinase/response regulator)